VSLRGALAATIRVAMQGRAVAEKGAGLAVEAVRIGAGRSSVKDWRTAEQARFAVGIATSAVAPTNFLAGNPAALERAFETGGATLVRGVRNLVHDVRHNRGMPSQVDTTPFTVGGNLAATPGAVVFRNELCEVIEYAPTTPAVRERPLLTVPPPIGKYYFLHQLAQPAARAG
jgi:polyhydroxyalkanoate synthase